ncbi:hypothetical protein ACRAWD_19020 [Caulobacter segnis]
MIRTWAKAWARFCAYYNAPRPRRQAALGQAAVDRYLRLSRLARATDRLGGAQAE